MRTPRAELGFGCWGKIERADVARDLLRDFIFGDFEVIAELKIHPECRRVFEIAGEAECRIGGHAAAFVDDVGDARDRYAEIQRDAIHAESERLHEFFAKDFSGVDGF